MHRSMLLDLGVEEVSQPILLDFESQNITSEAESEQLKSAKVTIFMENELFLNTFRVNPSW